MLRFFPDNWGKFTNLSINNILILWTNRSIASSIGPDSTIRSCQFDRDVVPLRRQYFMAFRAKSQSARIRNPFVSDEADEIPYIAAIHSSIMNVGGDITQLSYKELQALALRYHIPGNVKVSCYRHHTMMTPFYPSFVLFLPSVISRMLRKRSRINPNFDDRAPIMVIVIQRVWHLWWNAIMED